MRRQLKDLIMTAIIIYLTSYFAVFCLSVQKYWMHWWDFVACFVFHVCLCTASGNRSFNNQIKCSYYRIKTCHLIRRLHFPMAFQKPMWFVDFNEAQNGLFETKNWWDNKMQLYCSNGQNQTQPKHRNIVLLTN